MRLPAALLLAALLVACSSSPSRIVPIAAGEPAASPKEPPEPLRRVPPDYPSLAALQGVQAACAVSFDLEADGAPTNICVVCATTGEGPGFKRLFEGSTARMMTDWLYPPSDDDVEMRMGFATVIDFRVSQSARPPVGIAVEAPPAPVCARSPAP